MPKRLPIKAARDVCRAYGLRQVILVALDNDGIAHVVTYGVTLEDCALAAGSGNNLKRHMGFPEAACNAVPKRLMVAAK
jgi:hypothetical protein